MADFIAMLDPLAAGDELLPLLQQPYGSGAPRGRDLRLSWGRVAVLDDPIARGRNWVASRGSVLAWVGEWIGSGDEAWVKSALDMIVAKSDRGDEAAFFGALKESGLLDRLNGAYAVLVATPQHLGLITDPLGSVQVYLGRKGARVVALGTHPDLVARCAGDAFDIDPVSVGEFINTGIACCPHTMHRNVAELAPGTVWCRAMGSQGAADGPGSEFKYWIPPAESGANVDSRELEDAYVERWRKAMEARCTGSYIGVQLSGGLDSRVVMAAIAPERRCVGMTLCDTINREAEIARRVAAAYGRPWEPLYRDPEYLGQTLMPATRFVGCEGEWHHGHTLGFKDRIAEMGVDAVFTGLLMDNNFKGYYAQDVKRIGRLGGLLGARFELAPIDYPNQINAACRQHVKADIVDAIRARRSEFVRTHFARDRWSVAEWLDGYPYSQACDNTGWVIERRALPMRLPVMDRALVDLAFRVPMRLKAGGRFFERAAIRILGPGRSVPNANNGVKPGSGHLAMLAQRVIRKTENTRRRALDRLGIKQPVPHSWHDFQGYWGESAVFEDLRVAHAERLRELNAFRSDPVALVRSRTTPWQLGCRLLQLAAWKSILNDYRSPAC